MELGEAEENIEANFCFEPMLKYKLFQEKLHKHKIDLMGFGIADEKKDCTPLEKKRRNIAGK